MSCSTTTQDDIQVTANNSTKQFSLDETKKDISWTNNEIKLTSTETLTSSTISASWKKYKIEQ